ncbi:hypothetical protein LEP1GSC188_3971 [Leptospira weilii serovar Topaz str. LT2116]|uniref:Uncharacterized protein n=1 Tax=Leptospira weilii serovar Topaz str. LT2116 TaxID=1088540 RepID=M3G413_9LEPT|nr:hypothetical protein LEP1GSC188_3971 [Leptospira weilii serovar Topaz str. LT2116]
MNSSRSSHTFCLFYTIETFSNYLSPYEFPHFQGFETGSYFKDYNKGFSSKKQ